MKSITCIIITLFIIQAQQINGFSKKNQSDQRDLESDFKELPKPEQFREHLRTITREPHVAGDEGSKKVVSYLTQSMIKAGLKVEEFDYDIYLPNKPTFNSVEIVTPKRMPLNNKEDIRDRFSGSPQMSHGWNAYSGNGDVTAEVVYANFGRKEDFEELAKMGVSVKGKIAIARYGGNFRGYKAKYAQEAGAAGLIIYTDPENGGYASGLGYPEGPYASESTIQRGSLLTLPYVGDPLTPFEPALPVDGPKKVKRLKPDEIYHHTIPVTPLPYGSAKYILEQMTGQVVPHSWQGGLPFTYRIEGGKELTVRLKVEQEIKLTRVTDVVGTIVGS
ncbi:MAG: glutamate carboxypeptidase, partial [Calditrichaeota bacterium]|nr:glutamate carboxypeptidase [Calditrichota bacterium]